MCDKAAVQRLLVHLSHANLRRRADLREGLDYELSGRYRFFWVGARADAEALPLQVPALLQAPAGGVDNDDDDEDEADFDRDEAQFSLDLAALEAGAAGADDRFHFCGDPPDSERDNDVPDCRWVEQWDAATGTGWVEFEQEFDGNTSLHSWSVDLVPLG